MTTAERWRYARQPPTPGKVCKDCIEQFGEQLRNQQGKRPAPHPGPRCTTHHNAVRRERRIASKVKHVERTYDLTDAEYQELYRFQGGLCALCRRAKGTGKRRLAVDHDHRKGCGHDPTKGCKSCTRGLVCATCNDVLAHARDDPGFGALLAAYLYQWPTTRLASGGSWPPPAGKV